MISEALYPSEQTDEFDYARGEKLTTAQALFARATQKAAARDYDGALDDYSMAIEHDPEFLDAYVKRCQIRFVQGDDLGVLAACTEILKLDDTVAQAYYYQGRARFQLGAAPSAVASYSQAIALDEDYAQAWFHRGRARLELQENKLARMDLQQAAALFEAQGEPDEVHRVQLILENIGRRPFSKLQARSSKNKSLVTDIFMTISQFFWNPSGELLPTFARLSKRRAVELGIIYAAISTLCLLLATNLYQSTFISITLVERVLLGIVPFLSLVFMGQLTRSFTRKRGSWAGDIFISGATLLPLGVLVFLSALLIQFGPLGVVLSCFYLGCDAVLMLYFGCTQINNLSEQSATLAVPTLLLVSGGLTYGAYTLFAS